MNTSESSFKSRTGSLGASFALKKQIFDYNLQEHTSLGKVPAVESILKSSTGQKVEKLCGHSEWQPRHLYVTADKLLIVHPDYADAIADQIPLVFCAHVLSKMLRTE